MIITDNRVAGVLGSAMASAVDDSMTDGLFAGHLEAQMAKAGITQIGQDVSKEDPVTDAMSSIKKNGLVAYIMERHEKRIREEILASMGLTEEDLAKMSPEKRAIIEKTIAAEIQKRMAAEALMKKKHGREPDRSILEDIIGKNLPGGVLEMDF